MMPPWYKRLGIWLCEKLGHVCLQGGWIHDGHYHRDCSLCGRIVSESLKVVRLKKHNWFIRLFSKEKRREYKGWKSWEALHRKRSKGPIEVIPMKYEPSNLPPWYVLANYTYKNKENNMSKWITDRLPTVEDAPLNYVWTTFNDRTGFSRWDSVKDGVPWMPMLGPDPYEKPKQYVVQGFDGLEGVVYEVYSMGHKACVAGAIKTREAAERIAAIYEEVKP